VRDDTRNYVVVGAFVVAMLVALVVWIALLSGRTGPTDRYTIVYRSVLGLKEGVEILFEGYRVGRIEAIGPIDRDGRRRYRVEIAIARGWPIPEDTRARIATGLFSAPVIDLRAGRSETLLEPGSEIRGEEAADVFAAVNEMASQVNDLLEESVAPMLEEVARGAPEIVHNLESFSLELNRAMEQVREVLDPRNVEAVSSILANLDEVSSRTARLVSDLGETRRQLGSVIEQVDGLLDEERGALGGAAADLDHSLAAVARHIDAITANLEVTTRNLAEFSQQLRANPGVLIRGREAGQAP
jgi:phospholipid/cholesterol/gamma-HCH transport system substrate-binding protein